MFKAEDEFTSVTYDDNIATRLSMTALLDPYVEDVVQVDVGQQGRHRRSLRASLLRHDLLPVLQDAAYENYRRPQSTLPPDAPFWETCELDLFAPQSCFGHDLFPETACQPALTECPSLPEPGDTCEQSCPMASDGICDEEAGTGLCVAGCDPDDCTK